MSNKTKNGSPQKSLYYLINQICEQSEQPIKTGILTGIIQELDPKHHREVLRAIVKVFYSSGDEMACRRLLRALVRGIDYLMGNRTKMSATEPGGDCPAGECAACAGEAPNALPAKMQEVEKDKFESKYDPLQNRISYNAGFRNHCDTELTFIAGVLDMLFLVNEGDQWQNAGEEIAYVIMDARNRATALTEVV